MKTRTNLTRRRLLQTSLALPLASPAATAAAATAPQGNVYSRLGLRTFINAYGTLTTLGGTLILPEAKKAMEDASQHFVPVLELQKKVGEHLAELTGSGGALVTAGASCSLCLATCAVTAGSDPARMNQLPDITGMKNEIVIQKAHAGRNNPYEQNFRMIGTKLVQVETADEMRKAIGPQTAAVAMVLSHNSLGHKVELEEVISIAHAASVPVILDAAAEVPPADNLRKFVKMGTDLVAFSGGKNLRGPQCTGLLLGRKDLIDAAFANSSPSNHFARIAKVGKEEIIGLMTAVEIALKRDEGAQRKEFEAMLRRVADRLAGVPTLKTEFIPNLDYSHSPRLSVQWDDAKLGLTVAQVYNRLREGEPAIITTDMNRFRPQWKGIGIFANCLKPGEEVIVATRLRQVLSGKS